MNRRNRHSQYSRPSQSDKAWGLIASLGFLAFAAIVWLGL